jgi:hypothetical protein
LVPKDCYFFGILQTVLQVSTDREAISRPHIGNEMRTRNAIQIFRFRLINLRTFPLEGQQTKGCTNVVVASMQKRNDNKAYKYLVARASGYSLFL